MTTENKVEIRFSTGVGDDLDHICEIEAMCFEFPWKNFDFIETQSESNHCHFLVSETEVEGLTEMIGYVFFEVKLGSVEIIKMAIKPFFQRKNHGTDLINTIKNRLYPKDELIFYVPDDNSKAHHFLKKQEMKASIVKEAFAITSNHDPKVDTEYKDAYRFSWERP